MYRAPISRVPNQPGNFGSDLHALLSGLSRIVQLLFTGIPMITFMGSVSSFLGKFIAYLGCDTARTLPVGDLAAAEEAWSTASVISGRRVKLALLVAIGLAGLRIFLRKRQIESEESWESASDQEEIEENVQIPAPETIKSEEGRQPYAHPQFDQYQEGLWDQY